MSAAAPFESSTPALTGRQRRAVVRAGERIAPTWPLDRLIAVNPWWGMRDEAPAAVAGRLSALAGGRCLMPKSWYSERWPSPITDDRLRRAASELGVDADVPALRAHLRTTTPLAHWHNVSDLLDHVTHDGTRTAWHDEIIHQISQFCAAVLQPGGVLHERPVTAAGLYRAWLDNVRADHGIAILMGASGLRARFAELPEDHEALIAEAFDELGVQAGVATDYAHALLLDINGWASWLAYRRWAAGLAGESQDALPGLVAIRLAWELVLWRHAWDTPELSQRRLEARWEEQMAALPDLLAAHESAQRLTWVWQRALELAGQEALHGRLRAGGAEPVTAPRLQAAFCIDVRSEVMRRALEAQDPAIDTRGVAGFFGLPAEYRPVGTAYARPQLPGLLAAALTATEGEADGGSRRRRRLGLAQRWPSLASAPPAAFTLVEATGLLNAFRMLRDTVRPPARRHPVNSLRRGGDWTLLRDGEPVDATTRVELAAGLLRAMDLTEGFAPTVLLVGHGSSTRNNPHAAGLDCGACGGQTGEVNVRVMASLLNDPAVREGLTGQGIDIPAETRFRPALHDTTTQTVTCLDGPAGDRALQRWLTDAGVQARRECAPDLGLDRLGDRALHRALRRRGRDASEVQPEWGLAGNAAFVVAPRARTRGADLGGRVFLHDYRWQADGDHAGLEAILTGPMVVTHWINMQYNASVTDSRLYGSGNKVLHNVVGGHLGVFEGNGGDLRIGLPLQSVHDGHRWMHEPVRLSVYVAAPRAAIEAIARKHAVVAQLIDNEWLFLFRLDDDRTVERYHRDAWHPID